MTRWCRIVNATPSPAPRINGTVKNRYWSESRTSATPPHAESTASKPPPRWDRGRSGMMLPGDQWTTSATMPAISPRRLQRFQALDELQVLGEEEQCAPARPNTDSNVASTAPVNGALANRRTSTRGCSKRFCRKTNHVRARRR